MIRFYYSMGLVIDEALLPKDPIRVKRLNDREYGSKRHYIIARVRQQLNKAIKSGAVVRPSQCSQCGIQCRPHAHHPDYRKPLDVMWVCARCHGAQHKGDSRGAIERHGIAPDPVGSPCSLPEDYRIRPWTFA